MDTSEKLYDEKGILNCPFCSLKLKDPKELKCRCVLCYQCIDKHFKSPTQDNVKCPGCDTPSENPPEIKDISPLLEKLLQANSGSRHACESPGCNNNVRFPYMCVKCQLHLCKNCKRLVCPGVVKDIETTCEHEACPFENISPELSRIISMKKQNSCKDHERDLVYYCEKCHVCICELCKLDIHPHHHYVDINKKSDSYLIMLLEQCHALTKKLEENEAALRIYQDIVTCDAIPDIVSLEKCKSKVSWFKQKVEKCDCLIRNITQLKIFRSAKAILKIGKDIQEDISEQLKLSPLNDLRVVSEWWREIENKVNVSESAEQNTSIMDYTTTADDEKSTEINEKQRMEMASSFEVISVDSQEDKGPSKEDHKKPPKVLAQIAIEKQRTILTRSKTDKAGQDIVTDEKASTSGLKGKSSPHDQVTAIPDEEFPVTRTKTSMKRTIKTRSYTSGTNDDYSQRPGSGKAKRPRLTSCVEGSLTGSEGDFKRLSSTTTMHASFSLKSTVDEAKLAIAEVIGTDKEHLDIVDSGRALEGTKLVRDIQRPLQVVIHNVNRHVPVTLRTSAPDMVDPEEEGPRVEMSCGHAITPENLYRYCLNQITTPKSSFLCFAESGQDGGRCDKEWLFEEIAKKAGLSYDERVLFESLINRKRMNHSPEVLVCPNCRRICNTQNTKNACVKCIHCQKAGKTQFRFCCYCLEKWTPKHTCKKITAQETLNNCDRKTIVNVANCPSIRACPECHTLIQHSEGCKHMRCVNCFCTFCFICLCVRGDDGFECGSFDAVCKTAPIQSVA
ncbi:uncharacterized protein LOC117315564 [Pecten maximus]|uniref:uncharacterized protein LOC117315564 n=1 Tax=Pecten maximus TaxID=6579 RepID=UPI0014589BED|nr:uncharacterized protein LOC117315564 [Pecten maximus]